MAERALGRSTARAVDGLDHRVGAHRPAVPSRVGSPGDLHPGQWSRMPESRRPVSTGKRSDTAVHDRPRKAPSRRTNRVVGTPPRLVPSVVLSLCHSVARVYAQSVHSMHEPRLRVSEHTGNRSGAHLRRRPRASRVGSHPWEAGVQRPASPLASRRGGCREPRRGRPLRALVQGGRAPRRSGARDAPVRACV